MMAWFWLAAFLIGVPFSIVVHETGHLLVGLRNGWKYEGVFFKPAALGVGVRMGHRSKNPCDWNLGRVALAGPIASLLLAYLLWVLEPIPEGGNVFSHLAGMNLAIAALNLLPTPITDGGHIVRGLFGYTIKWRHLFGIWIVLEAVGIILFLLAGWKLW